MKIDILTIFPEAVDGYLKTSIMHRAQSSGHVDFALHNIRDFSTSKHKNVDDTPYGGGAGMVMQVEPIHRVVESLEKKSKPRVILMSAKGKRYTQSDAKRLMSYDQLIFICGRYEGVDERVAENIADEEMSIGDYVLTGGELGSLVVIDSVVRLLPGVLGNEDSAVYESHSEEGYKEHPHYTKPEDYEGWKVPKALVSGNHGLIEQWRDENATK